MVPFAFPAADRRPVAYDLVERIRVGQKPALNVRVRTRRHQSILKHCPCGIFDFCPFLSEGGTVAVDGGDNQIGRTVKYVHLDQLLIRAKLLECPAVTSAS